MARTRSPRNKVGHVLDFLAERPLAKPVALKFLEAHGFSEPMGVYAAIDRLRQEPIQRKALREIFPALMRDCERSADSSRAFVNFGRLVDALPNPNMFYHYLRMATDRLEWLVKVFAHSQALSDTLARNAAHFHFLIAPETLAKPREKIWLAAELQRLLLPVRVPARKYDVIRRFRRRETLRIGVRDLIGRATVEETTLELSNLADVCLQAVYDIALQKLAREFKLTTPLRFAVIGMGKLGGQELNYSSDVDVIFVYDEDGDLTPTLTRHEVYTKLAEEIIRVVGSPGEEGNIFRIDLRLRPEGSSGPLARSLDNCENYYAERGETWERMALIKARCVAGDAALGQEFIQMVQPFVYSRHAGANVVQQMAAIKKRIENEIVRDERLTRHVKLGVGGIREIEFICQSFQVLHGARLVLLRERSTLRALQQLVRARLLSEADAQTLANAYRFLRNVEHRLQMEMELQTHTIPDEEQALYRLARSLGFDTVEKFQNAQNAHTGAVRKIYESVLVTSEEHAGERGVEQLTPERLPEVLTTAGFGDVPAAMRIVDGLLHGGGFGHVSERTQQLFAALFPLLMQWAGKVAEPDVALLRFDRFVNAYGARGLLYEILIRHPKLVELLMRVGDASRLFSETLAKHPELFDEVCRAMAFVEPKSAERMREELAAACRSAEIPAGDAAREWKRAELLRIGVEDVMRLVDLEQVHHEITRLAEVCLAEALEQARRELKLAKLPFAIIGVGKLGAREIGYGADLDVLFVGGRNAADQEKAIRLANGVTDFMTRQTAAGSLFAVDARLRPDGLAGPLASSLEAHRDYYRQRAQLWERQALVKARFVAGDEELGDRFVEMVHGIVYQRELTGEELKEIQRMRHRIETERGNQKNVELEFKTGPGGLMDVEFAVQTLQLRNGHAHGQLRTAHTLAALNRLTALGVVEDMDAHRLREGYLFLRRIESVLRCEEGASVSHLPSGTREQAALAKRMGFASAEELLNTYRYHKERVREIYRKLMS